MKNMIICLQKRMEDKNESKGHIEKKCFLAYGSLHVFGNNIMQCCFWHQYCGRANRYADNLFYYRYRKDNIYCATGYFICYHSIICKK